MIAAGTDVCFTSIYTGSEEIKASFLSLISYIIKCVYNDIV